jgi:membrane protease YdiL (CAAX protease family)
MEARGGGPPGAAPARRLSWGVPDAVVAFLLSLVASLVAEAPFATNGKIPARLQVSASLAGLGAQTAAVVVYLAFAARRGGGSLTRDFGLRVSARDAPWFFVGFIVSAVAGVLLTPIIRAGHLTNSSQEVVHLFQKASGANEVVFVVAVLVVAPVGEELLFRGVLLRSLLRRTDPPLAVGISALAFALVHVALDPGAGFAVPALFFLGLLSGYRALERGDLSQSILLHAGFNLLAVLQILL